jgi:hypothetical protein
MYYSSYFFFGAGAVTPGPIKNIMGNCTQILELGWIKIRLTKKKTFMKYRLLEGPLLLIFL